MGCKLAENRPLSRLRAHLGLHSQCHSRRPTCVRGLTQDRTETTMGAPGAVLGYCQALFAASSSPEFHTHKVMRLLGDLGAPWSRSHELFWGYRIKETPGEFVTRGAGPLCGDGRVPIVITGLDPARDADAIASILSSDIPVASGETVLLRIVLRNSDSIIAVASLLRSLVEQAFHTQAMPQWWPLLQGSLSASAWATLRELTGPAWQYANVAINPFTEQDVFSLCATQITVAQVVVGGPDGVRDSDVFVPGAMQILGTAGDAVYSVADFIAQLRNLEVVPTIILLGPSQPTWSDEVNQERVNAVLTPLRHACDELWSALPVPRREYIWAQSA